MHCMTPSISYKDSISFKDKNCIFETIKKIDQIQKEALIQEECDNCEGGLMFKLFNTKPVILYLEKGKPFKAEIPGTAEEYTKYFRIQEIKGDCVVLRLLVHSCDKWICTNFTVTLKIGCICAIQCLPPICCKECRNVICPRIE